MLLFKKKSKKNDEVDYELPAAYIEKNFGPVLCCVTVETL